MQLSQTVIDLIAKAAADSRRQSAEMEMKLSRDVSIRPLSVRRRSLEWLAIFLDREIDDVSREGRFYVAKRLEQALRGIDARGHQHWSYSRPIHEATLATYRVEMRELDVLARPVSIAAE